MFDIHYHLLAGVDDGPKDPEISLKLAEASIAEGVTHIVATPHANERYAFRPEVNRELLSTLQERLQGRVTLGLGCDFHLSFDNLEDLERNPQKYTINGTQYLLVEFSDFGILRHSDEMFYRMRAADLIPIITHPERNPELVRSPNKLDRWIEMGCLVQVTAASFGGHFGRRAKEMAFDLVRRNRAHVVASDAHDLKHRPPSMRVAFDLLKSEFGEECAKKLCLENPGAVFTGSPIPHFESIVDASQPNPRAEGSFWRRIFGGRG